VDLTANQVLDLLIKLLAIVLPIALSWYVAQNQSHGAKLKKAETIAKFAMQAVLAAEDMGLGGKIKGSDKLKTAIDIFIAAVGKVQPGVADSAVRAAYTTAQAAGAMGSKAGGPGNSVSG
jgi:hypothetical protein